MIQGQQGTLMIRTRTTVSSNDTRTTVSSNDTMTTVSSNDTQRKALSFVFIVIKSSYI